MLYHALKGLLKPLWLATPWGRDWAYRKQYNRLRRSGVDHDRADETARFLVQTRQV